MTILNGKVYCDSVPCSLRDELPKQTNADRIRSMSDEELAKFIKHISHNCLMNALFSVNDEDCKHYEDCESCREAHKTVKEWIQSEAE